MGKCFRGQLGVQTTTFYTSNKRTNFIHLIIFKSPRFPRNNNQFYSMNQNSIIFPVNSQFIPYNACYFPREMPMASSYGVVNPLGFGQYSCVPPYYSNNFSYPNVYQYPYQLQPNTFNVNIQSPMAPLVKATLEEPGIRNSEIKKENPSEEKTATQDLETIQLQPSNAREVLNTIMLASTAFQKNLKQIVKGNQSSEPGKCRKEPYQPFKSYLTKKPENPTETVPDNRLESTLNKKKPSHLIKYRISHDSQSNSKDLQSGKVTQNTEEDQEHQGPTKLVFRMRRIVKHNNNPNKLHKTSFSQKRASLPQSAQLATQDKKPPQQQSISSQLFSKQQLDNLKQTLLRSPDTAEERHNSKDIIHVKREDGEILCKSEA